MNAHLRLQRSDIIVVIAGAALGLVLSVMLAIDLHKPRECAQACAPARSLFEHDVCYCRRGTEWMTAAPMPCGRDADNQGDEP